MTFDELAKRRTELVLQKDIPDMAAYADEWNKLGTDFEALGAKANAAICFSNWKRYGGLRDAYKREIVGSIATLTPEVKSVTVKVNDTAIRFPDADKFAGWLAEVME